MAFKPISATFTEATSEDIWEAFDSVEVLAGAAA